MDGVFLEGQPQSFRHQRRPVDDCSPGRGGTAQDAKQGAERFMAKWIGAGKDPRIAQSKQDRAVSLTIVGHKWRELVSSGGVWFADFMSCFFDVTFVVKEKSERI